MAYTETTTAGYGSRLSHSLKGIIIGLVLFIIGTILLFWNEGNYINTYKAIKEAESAVVPVENVTAADPALNGKLIHASAPATTKDTLRDDSFGVETIAVKLKRQVEYYQWTETAATETRDKIGGGQETKTTYTYAAQWQNAPVDSAKFHDPDYKNRNFVLATVEKNEQIAGSVTFGAYTLPDFLKSSLSGETPAEVHLTAEQIKQWEDVLAKNKPSGESSAKSPLVHAEKNVVYFGENPGAAQVGDVKITLTKVDPAVVSLIAKVAGSTFETYRTKNGRDFSCLKMGTVSAAAMFESSHQSNTILTWVLRIAGTILVVFALNSMFSIIPALFKVLPFLGNIAGAGVGLVCILGGAAWSVFIIAAAWLFYRPLFGLLLLALAATAVWYLCHAAKNK